MDPLIIIRDLLNLAKLYEKATLQSERDQWRRQFAEGSKKLGDLMKFSGNSDLVLAYQISCSAVTMMFDPIPNGISHLQFRGAKYAWTA